MTYRLRVIGITDDAPIELNLGNDDKPIEWRAIARDGMTLPAGQATRRSAKLVFDPGQIFDYEFTPQTPGELTLQYGFPQFAMPPGYKQTSVAVRVH